MIVREGGEADERDRHRKMKGRQMAFLNMHIVKENTTADITHIHRDGITELYTYTYTC